VSSDGGLNIRHRWNSSRGSPLGTTGQTVVELTADKEPQCCVKTDGKVTTVNTVTISKDRKTYTQRQKGTNAQGQPTNNVVVYDRQ
jgi:hypothetical protein